MEVSREIITQYADLQKEVEETRDKIVRLEDEIERIQKRISDIENGEKVKDKVRGGLGGIQNFEIEGVPSREYSKKKSDLMVKKLLLNQRKSTLEIQEFELLQMTNDVEEYLHGIKDSHMRRIINLRVVEQLSWNEVADKIGGGNTSESVRKAFDRFIS